MWVLVRNKTNRSWQGNEFTAPIDGVYTFKREEVNRRGTKHTSHAQPIWLKMGEKVKYNEETKQIEKI